MPRLRDGAPADGRRTPQALRRPVSALVLASDEGWQRLVDRVGDHVLLTRLLSIDGRLEASDVAVDVLLLAYDPPKGASPAPHWMHRLNEILGAHRAPVVVYAPLQAAIVRAVGDWTVLGVAGLVFSGIDDADGAEFAALLRESSSRSVARELARTILIADKPWPSDSREVIGKLFAAPGAYRSVDDLARGVGVTRRSLERWATHAGLVSLRRLLVVARLARIYGALPRGQGSTRLLALDAGFTSAAQLRAALRAIFGARDLAEFATLSRRRVLATLVAALNRGDVDAPTDVGNRPDM